MHFQRNPLAIVNVKGRAKGTSVQEVIAKLKVDSYTHYNLLILFGLRLTEIGVENKSAGRNRSSSGVAGAK